MCGIFGAFSPTEMVLEDVYLGLSALQHRGQESAGVAWIDPERRINLIKKMGLVHEALDQEYLASLPAKMAVGHVRYSTAGGTMVQNTQPLGANYAQGPVAIAHNGNLTNAPDLTRLLENRGAIFQSSSDSECILQLMAHQPQKPPLKALLTALEHLQGAFSLVVLLEEGLVAARDVWGLRPLALGRRDGNYYISSESCAFHLIGAEFVRDLEPGEVLLINDKGLTSFHLPEPPNLQRRICAFEFVYIARPDSVIDGRPVYQARKNMGSLLAQTLVPANADMVASLPDSGTPAALGYAAEAKLPYEAAVVRNRYVGRTFIQPTQKVRELGVRIKLSPNAQTLAGRGVVLVDDSLVRGTTAGRVVNMVRACQVKSLHLYISSPPVRFPCFYGIDTPSPNTLAAANFSPEEIKAKVGADTLVYLDEDKLAQAIGRPKCELCLACFNGDYLPQTETVLKLD